MNGRRTLLASLTGMLLAWSLLGTAQAHDDAYLDSLTAPHGGQIRMAGTLHLELVLDKSAKGDKPQSVEVYVTDHAGTKQEVAGAVGTATLLSGGHKVSVALMPQGDNKLHGEGLYTAGPELKAIVSVTLKGAEAQQARFTPWAPKDKQAHH